MSKAADIYQAIKGGATVPRSLSDPELRELLGHLGRKGKTCGNAGRIWGEALAEAALRFMRGKKHRKGEGAEALTDFITTDPDA